MKHQTGTLSERYSKIPASKKYLIEAYLFIGPWIIGFLVFQLYPFISSLYYSFTDYALLSEPHWVGLSNYIKLFTADSTFAKSLVVTVKYVFITVPCKLAFALLIAMILNLKIKGIGTFRTIYYLPSILGGSVGLAILWRFLFSGDGALNKALSNIGITGPNWLGDPNIALGTLSLLAVWQFGSSMVLFLAALKQVPATLYEAALVDGSGPVRNFFKITIPMISPIILFNTIMQLITAFQEFAAPFLITNGGPIKETYLYSMMLYDTAFRYMKMGYSCALSWIMFLIIFVLTLLIFKTSAGKVYYEDGGAQS